MAELPPDLRAAFADPSADVLIAIDFDGTSLTGSERAVTVGIASGATTTVDGGTLRIVGVSGNETTISNQGSGQYSFNVSGGIFLAQYYDYRNLDATGLNFSGTPTISSLSYGDFELAVDGGSLITLSSTRNSGCKSESASTGLSKQGKWLLHR